MNNIRYKIYVWNSHTNKYIQLFKSKDKSKIIKKFNDYHKNLVSEINKSWGLVKSVDNLLQIKYHQITNDDHKPYIIDLSTNKKENLLIII